MRSIASSKNIVTGLGAQFLSMLLNFAVRTVFIYTLSAKYLGINGLFSSILSILNLAELGIGTAIVFELYKPLATNDKKRIKSLIHFYRKAFFWIGLSIVVLGISLMPFLDKLISKDTGLVNLYFIFALYLFQTVSSYWFYAYKSALLVADQKMHVISKIKYFVSISSAVLSVLTLVLLRNTPTVSFYFYCCIGISTNIALNIVVGRKTDKLYPYLHEKDYHPLAKEDLQPIFRNVLGLSVAKVSNALFTTTDSIFISSFVGITAVGYFSNYLMILKNIQVMLGVLFGSITASVGNLCATQSAERTRDFFDNLHMVYGWVYGFCAICLFNLFNPFMGGVWINNSYLLSNTTVILITTNFLLDGLAGAITKYREANGLFYQGRYRYLASAIINAVLSFLFGGPLNMGVEGILFATTLSVIVMLIYDPIIVFKNVFQAKARTYYLKYLASLLIILATAASVHLICLPFSAYNMTNFLIRLTVCIVFPNLFWFILFRNRPEFKYLCIVAKNIKTHFFGKRGGNVESNTT